MKIKKRSSTLRRSKRVYFCVILCVLILWSIFGFFYFGFRKENIRYLKIRHLPPPKGSPLTKYLVEIARRNFAGKQKPFSTAIGPLGGGGTGNQHIGIANMILYSIFTNSSLLIPGNTYFQESESVFTDFFPFQSRELQNYFLFPSPDFQVEKIVDSLHQDCAPSSMSSYGSMSKLVKIIRNTSPRILYSKIKYIVPESSFQPKKDDIHGAVRMCEDKLCKDFFQEIKSRNQIYHDPKQYLNPKSNVACFPTYQYYYWVFHVFRSRAKTDFLCDTLKLCDGINREFVKKNCYNNACQREGLILMGNIFRSLFQINEEKAMEITRKYQKKRNDDEDDFFRIGVHVRTLMTGFTSRDGVENVSQCLVKVIESMKDKYKTKLENFEIILAGDVDFDLNQRFLSKLNNSLYLEKKKKKKKKFKEELFQSIRFRHNQIGTKYLHGIWESIEGSSVKGKSSTFQLFMDIYSLTKSDVLVFSQYSSFASVVGSFGGDSMIRNKPFWFPLAGKGFKWIDDKVLEKWMPCSNRIPYQPCSEENCPVDYL